LKTPLRKAWLPALILAVAFNMVACGDAGGGDGGGQQGSGSGGDGEQGTAEKTGGMGRMDRDQMGHGSMGMGSGGMARQMVMENGKYSDKAFIDAMIPHHRSAIDMAKIAYEKSEHPRIKELAENIVSAQQEEIEEMKRWRQRWYSQG
jgi:uncharacterized protein (DUF305 family)